MSWQVLWAVLCCWESLPSRIWPSSTSHLFYLPYPGPGLAIAYLTWYDLHLALLYLSPSSLWPSPSGLPVMSHLVWLGKHFELCSVGRNHLSHELHSPPALAFFTMPSPSTSPCLGPGLPVICLTWYDLASTLSCALLLGITSLLNLAFLLLSSSSLLCDVPHSPCLDNLTKYRMFNLT